LTDVIGLDELSDTAVLCIGLIDCTRNEVRPGSYIVGEMENGARKIHAAGFSFARSQSDNRFVIGAVLRGVVNGGGEVLQPLPATAVAYVVVTLKVPAGTRVILGNEDAAWRDLEDDRAPISLGWDAARITREDHHVALVACGN
jgi:hypothetical protein